MEAREIEGGRGMAMQALTKLQGCSGSRQPPFCLWNHFCLPRNIKLARSRMTPHTCKPMYYPITPATAVKQRLQLNMTMTRPTTASRLSVRVGVLRLFLPCPLQGDRLVPVLWALLSSFDPQPCPFRCNTFGLPIFEHHLARYRISRTREPHTCLVADNLLDVDSALAAFAQLSGGTTSDGVSTWSAHSHTWLWLLWITMFSIYTHLRFELWQ